MPRPNVPRVTNPGIPQDLRTHTQAVKQAFDADGRDRICTWGDLEDAGLARINNATGKLEKVT